jgi:hypothetical protein
MLLSAVFRVLTAFHNFGQWLNILWQRFFSFFPVATAYSSCRMRLGLSCMLEKTSIEFIYVVVMTDTP